MRAKISTVMDRRRLLLNSGAGLLAGASALEWAAQPAAAEPALDKVRFICDFRIYGATSPFFYGLDLGLFKQAGIDLSVDGSTGSADAIVKVASGAYGFGCADISTLVEFTSRNKDTAPKLAMPIYDRCSAAIVSRKSQNITSFKSLEGHTLGTGTADSGSRILPALLRLQHVDASKIVIKPLEVALRDTMLLANRVDAVIGNDYTVLFNLAGKGVKPDEMNVVYYADNGFDFFGQGMIVDRAIAAKDPDLGRRMALAVVKSWVAAAKDPEASVDSAIKRDGLLDKKIETARLKWVLDRLIFTPNVRANGFGVMDVGRMQNGINVLAEGFKMSSPPTVADIFDPKLLPDSAARRI